MSLPPGENIIETKICPISGEEFFVTDKDIAFYDAVSPVFGGKKYAIPSPKLCSMERMRRRECFRNEGFLYMRKCDLTGKDIMTMYHPLTQKVVYDHEAWWTDAWDVVKYQKVFDFDRPFFEQFQDFYAPIPFPALYNSNNENCHFNNFMIGCKNCYMSSVVYYGSENVLYSRWTFASKDIVDSYQVYDSEKCFNVGQVNKCNSCQYMTRSSNCSNCFYSQYLTGCTDCFLCSGLFQKQYHIFNTSHTPEEYRKKLAEFLCLPEHEKMKFFQDFLRKQTVRNLYSFKSENSIGDGIINCKDSFGCFDSEELENCRHIRGQYMKNCWDGVGGKIDNSYEFNRAGITGNGCLFVNDCVNSSSVYYCNGVYNISDSFACCGLHNHEHHCILNTPYSVQEYEMLCGKIIDHMKTTGEWGEFFPHTSSPFGYNETLAQEDFPMTEEEIHERGWNWRADETKSFTGDVVQPFAIEQYDERIVGFDTAQRNINELLKGVIRCEVTGKPFKIIRQELAFYIENHISVPTKHPDQRHRERIQFRNPRKLFERQCAECRNDIITTYALERPERVVCEECYRKLVY